MMPKSKTLLGNIRGRKHAKTHPALRMIKPIRRQINPKTEMISLIFLSSCSKRGLYRTQPMAVLIPNSARFRKPKRLFSVPISPIKSAPNASRKIFLEKKDKAKLRKQKMRLTRALSNDFLRRDSCDIFCFLQAKVCNFFYLCSNKHILI